MWLWRNSYRGLQEAPNTHSNPLVGTLQVGRVHKAQTLSKMSDPRISWGMTRHILSLMRKSLQEKIVPRVTRKTIFRMGITLKMKICSAIRTTITTIAITIVITRQWIIIIIITVTRIIILIKVLIRIIMATTTRIIGLGFIITIIQKKLLQMMSQSQVMIAGIR
jgi:hypothetical protein